MAVTVVPEAPLGEAAESLALGALDWLLGPTRSAEARGTAEGLALACDRQAEQADGPGFAGVLVADLAERATADADGVRWSNHEHRAEPAVLGPRTGWAMGSAGIIRELLRFARLGSGTDPAYAVPWPDHPGVRAPGLATAA